MNDQERQSTSDAHAAGPDAAALLAPQLLLRPTPLAAVAVLGVGLSAGMAFMFSNDFRTDVAKDSIAERDKVFSVPTDQVTGTFRILADSFQRTPGSVLAQLKMPEAEKKRLADKLADGGVRLAVVTAWDTVDEDGDTVDIIAASFSQRLVIMHKPAMFFVPVQPGGSVVIRAVRDGGGGGVTLGVSTILGPYRLPALAVGQSVEIPAL